jgi:hypothetical protein
MAPRKDIGNVDAALEELGRGNLGRYTTFQYSMHLLAQIAIAHHMLSIIFTGELFVFTGVGFVFTGD